MNLRAITLVAGLGVVLGTGVWEDVLGSLGLDESDPGRLARALASTDPDIDAAIVALEAGDLDTALEHLTVAEKRRGERPEIHYDRGLLLLAKGDKEGAQAAFQHGTESEHLEVKASSHYELGNLAMGAEDWEGAIAQYIDCLRAQPTHENAKWNLELALQRKEEQEKQEQEDKDKQENQDKDNQDKDNQDKDQQDQENQDKENQDQQGQDQQDQQNQDEQQQDQQDQQQQDQQQNQEQQQQDQQQQQTQPKPVEAGDLDAALEELDRQDAFMFGRPRPNRKPVEKDW